jgi:hypothetical protein
LTAPALMTGPPLDKHVATLHQIIDQDLEPDPSGGGRLRIREGVAEDRRRRRHELAAGHHDQGNELDTCESAHGTMCHDRSSHEPPLGSRWTTKTRAGVGRSRLATAFPVSRGAR